MPATQTLSIERLVPLGDQAVLVFLTTEDAALAFADQVRRAPFPWLVDVVHAYASVAIFFDLNQVHFADAARSIQHMPVPDRAALPEARHHRIPCCYDFALDLACVSEHCGLCADEIIRLHAETEYTVYAIGFCPGFPYLGYLPPAISGVPRLPTPRLRVEPGMVGLTGRQTGIYTQPRPGGWNLVGRTPLVLVDPEDDYFPLRTGDRVRFERIDESEFRRLDGERL